MRLLLLIIPCLLPAGGPFLALYPLQHHPRVKQPVSFLSLRQFIHAFETQPLFSQCLQPDFRDF